MTGLLGGPAVRPFAPDALASEHPVDGLEVVRQVVLGEQVDEEGAAQRVGNRHLIGVPDKVGFEVTTHAPRNELVRVPRLARLVVPSSQLLGDLSEFVEECCCRSSQTSISSLPTGR